MKIIHKEKEKEAKSISSLEAYSLAERIKMERPSETNAPLQSILKYLRTIPIMGSASWAERVRKSLTAAGMTDYEASLVINLCPEGHTDAKTLIPALSRFDNYTLDILLNEISDLPN